MGPTPFTTSLPFAKTPVGRLAVDDRCVGEWLHGPSVWGASHPVSSSLATVPLPFLARTRLPHARNRWRGCA